MKEIILNGILWILAMYGAIEIIKVIYRENICKAVNLKDTHIIITIKNQENFVEGFLRTFIGNNEEYIENIIIADMDSEDKTKEILEKLNYRNIRIADWHECKQIIDNINKI